MSRNSNIVLPARIMTLNVKNILPGCTTLTGLCSSLLSLHDPMARAARALCCVRASYSGLATRLLSTFLTEKTIFPKKINGHVHNSLNRFARGAGGAGAARAARS